MTVWEILGLGIMLQAPSLPLGLSSANQIGQLANTCRASFASSQYTFLSLRPAICIVHIIPMMQSLVMHPPPSLGQDHACRWKFTEASAPVVLPNTCSRASPVLSNARLHSHAWSTDGTALALPLLWRDGCTQYVTCLSAVLLSVPQQPCCMLWQDL